MICNQIAAITRGSPAQWANFFGLLSASENIYEYQ